MEYISDISELVLSGIGIGALLAFVAWVIGSVINITITIIKKG